MTLTVRDDFELCRRVMVLTVDEDDLKDEETMLETARSALCLIWDNLQKRPEIRA